MVGPAEKNSPVFAPERRLLALPLLTPCSGEITLQTVQRQLPPNRLRELRESRELKLYDIAARYRKDPSTVHRWESGRALVPDEIKLDLADFYGVTVAHLMGWPEKVAA